MRDIERRTLGGKRPTGRSRPEGEAVRHPGVRFSGLEGEGAKGSRISSGAKRRASYGDREEWRHARVAPTSNESDRPGRPVSDARRSQAALRAHQ